MSESVQLPTVYEIALAISPWWLLAINDADVIASVDAPVKITWTDQPTADLPVITSNPGQPFDWKADVRCADIPTKPETKPLRSYIIAPDCSKAIPLEAVEFRREDGRVVWSEGKWPAGAKSLSAAELDHLKNMKAKP